MYRSKIFLGFLSLLIFIPLTSVSEATLWDLVIIANVENTPMYSGDRPIVSGIVLDQASKPVSSAEINVKSGSMSIFTKTSQSGEFMAELGNHERLPGNYVVNISAVSADGKTGISSIQFQVKGEISPSEISQQKLITPEAKKYLDSSPNDFEGNPVGFMLYNYYQKIYQEYLKDEKKTQELTEKQDKIDEQKRIAEKLRLEAIEEFNPSIGVFSGDQYENYVNGLDEIARETVIQHLTFTKNLVEEAQNLRKEILEKGGSVEEAQAAYLEKITTSREMIENLDKTQNSNSTKIATADSTIKKDAFSEINEKKSPIQVDVSGINLEVDFRDSIFLVNVNGTMLEFMINGTDITQIKKQD